MSPKSHYWDTGFFHRLYGQKEWFLLPSRSGSPDPLNSHTGVNFMHTHSRMDRCIAKVFVLRVRAQAPRLGVPRAGGCRGLTLRPGPWARLLELDLLNIFIRHDMLSSLKMPVSRMNWIFLWFVICNTVPSDEFHKKICFPGTGKPDRLAEKGLNVFISVFVCLLKLLVFNLLITRGCCLLRKQKHKTTKIVYEKLFCGPVV